MALIQRTRTTEGNIKLSIINMYLPKFNSGATSTYIQALNTVRRTDGQETADGI